MKDEKGIVAVAALKDTLREEAIEAIKDLKQCRHFHSNANW